MSLGDLLNEIRQIDQSRPEYLNGVAAGWQASSSALDAQKVTVGRALTDVSDGWESQKDRVANYSGQVTDGMDKLIDGADTVAAALRGAVPQLQSLKSALSAALAGFGVAVVGAILSGGAGALLGVVDVVAIVNVVNEYHTTMSVLGGALGDAQRKFDTMGALSAPGGSGVVPPPPTLPTTPD